MADTSPNLVAISDEETSDVGDIEVSIVTKRAAVAPDDNDDDDNEMLDVFGEDEVKDEQDKDDDDDEEEEDLEEDVCACLSLPRRALSLYLLLILGS